MSTNVVVTGATGTQGGSVIDALASGEYGEFEIRGLTRDASSERARALAERGVEVVEGDMHDAERMAELFADVDRAFVVTTFFESGTDAEIEQGRTAVTAAAEAGVDHVVYSSVGGADRDTGLAHFESKAAVEETLRGLDVGWTVLRPVFFMQNFERELADEIEAGRLPMALAEGVTLQLVDATDIGRAAAMALADPGRFAGETIELAGDELDLEAIAAAFGAHLGTEIEPIHVDVESYRAEAGDELADMFAWFDEVGYDADPADLRERYGLAPTDLAGYLAASERWTSPPTPTR